MVCPRCELMVASVIEKNQLTAIKVSLGQVELAQQQLSDSQTQQLAKDLQALGFELLADKKKILVSRIKSAVVDLVHRQDSLLKINLSDYLSQQIQSDYAQLSSIFSAEEKNTIEHYYIQQKIERVKELLSYGELSLSAIAYQLNYSSVAHLSAQFKKVTGQSPSQYKTQQNRKGLDTI